MTDSARKEHHHAGYGIDARAGIRALEPLSELDEYRIADDGPDIRGWRVAATDGRVGCVRDLLVDTAAMSVRFLDVELDTGAPQEQRANALKRHVLVPLSIADLDEEFHEVRLPTVTADALTCLPEYHREPVTPEREREVVRCFQERAP